ncbi:MAG TPA: hypothetical protein VM841_08325 [Actinomycetota bacterium]|nr:hypothetical protein [Actinomycetota bacterium]
MKKLSAVMIALVVSLAGSAALAGHGGKTYCEENNKRNGMLTKDVHEMHDRVKPISPELAEIIHDEVEPRTCE